MHGRVMTILAVVLCVSMAAFAAPERERPDRGERTGEGDKAPTTGRGPGASGRPYGGDGVGRGGGMHRGGYRGKPLTKEQEAELLKHFKKNQPEMHKRLVDLSQRDASGYRRMLSWLWGPYQELIILPAPVRAAAIEKDTARHEAYHLLKAIRDTQNAKKKAELTEKLREAMARQFKAEQIVRTYRLTKLAKEIQRTLDEIKARTAKETQEIIDSRVESMLKSSGRPPSYRERGAGGGPGGGPGSGPKPPAGKGRGPADGEPRPKD